MLLIPTLRRRSRCALCTVPRTARLILIAPCLLLVGFALHVHAQSSGGDFALTRFAVAGGGGAGTGGASAVVTTAGQPAGIHSGGVFQLVGGFHLPATDAGAVRLFCDSFEASPCL